MPTFLPFIFGKRNPGWRYDRLGSFLDIRPNHSFRDMYRALQADILFNLYKCFEALTRETGWPEDIYVSGGVLNSALWTQMTADIFGQGVRCVKDRDASSIGAAALVLHAVSRARRRARLRRRRAGREPSRAAPSCGSAARLYRCYLRSM